MCLLLHQKSHGGLVAVVVFFELPLSPLFDLAPTKLSFTDQIFIVNLFFVVYSLPLYDCVGQRASQTAAAAEPLAAFSQVA